MSAPANNQSCSREVNSVCNTQALEQFMEIIMNECSSGATKYLFSSPCLIPWTSCALISHRTFLTLQLLNCSSTKQSNVATMKNKARTYSKLQKERNEIINGWIQVNS